MKTPRTAATNLVVSSQPGLGKALFTLEGSVSFVTVTHCCWEPKNTFINGKIGLAPQSNILPSVEELPGGSEYILRKYGFFGIILLTFYVYKCLSECIYIRTTADGTVFGGSGSRKQGLAGRGGSQGCILEGVSFP